MPIVFLPCPECEKATVGDIVFLVDGSSSIGDADFRKVRNFLLSIIKGLDIGANKVRVGLAQFSDDANQEFLLKDHMDKKALLAAVERLPYRQGGTYTGKALDYMREHYFTESAGSRARQRVPQIAVVITDGESTDEVEAPALRLREQGVTMISIGVGQYDRLQLQSIANFPPNRFVYTIENFQDLLNKTSTLLTTVCVFMEQQKEGKRNQ